jgi:protein SCO1/2
VVTLGYQKMNMSRKAIFYIGFFVVLTLIFYFAIAKSIRKNDTISVVQPFAFVNQDGKTVTDKDVEGKVYVAEYFFTTCTGICPRMNNNMRTVYNKFKDEKDFLILSHTCDPERDSVGQIKKYADSMQVNTAKWIFLTGRKDSLYTMARNSYTIDDPANNVNVVADDFLHTQFWALVNKRGEVKKVYDGLKQSEINAMMKQISKLLKE